MYYTQICSVLLLQLSDEELLSIPDDWDRGVLLEGDFILVLWDLYHGTEVYYVAKILEKSGKELVVSYLRKSS